MLQIYQYLVCMHRDPIKPERSQVYRVLNERAIVFSRKRFGPTKFNNLNN
jgi:hypothetical protein